MVQNINIFCFDVDNIGHKKKERKRTYTSEKTSRIRKQKIDKPGMVAACCALTCFLSSLCFLCFDPLSLHEKCA